VVALLRDTRCDAKVETIEMALTNQSPAEHPFALGRTLALRAAYQAKTSACDAPIEAVLKDIRIRRGRKADPLPSPGPRMCRGSNRPNFDVRAALFALFGEDATQIHGLRPCPALQPIAACGDDVSAGLSAKHFSSRLCLAPSNKTSGGKVLSSPTRISGSGAAAFLGLAAATIGRTDTPLGALRRGARSQLEAEIPV
jgi:hypothetical protein